MRERHDTVMLEQVTTALANRLEAPAKALNAASGRLDEEVQMKVAERQAEAQVSILRAKSVSIATMLLCLAVLAIALGLMGRLVLGAIYTENPSVSDTKPISSPVQLPTLPPSVDLDNATVTSNFTLFRQVAARIGEQELTVQAGHHFAKSTDTDFEHAWCYSDITVEDVTYDLMLGIKNPGSKAILRPISDGMQKATGLKPADHRALFEKCPWLDGNPNVSTGSSRSNTYELRGEVDQAAVDRLIAAVEQGVKLVRLNSPGGDMGHAMRAFDFLAAANVDTEVRGICASACSIIFLAGNNRHVPVGSSFGVHQWVSLNNAVTEAETQFFAAEIMERFKKAGVDEALFINASKTPPSRMYWLSEYELKVWGVTRSGLSS
ncbi:MAG: ATP-dependent Clp protease proteolytic subunit [Rhodobacteraceae bacterium]|nr:ATP-dependent Clp protease proteolytic subunit [Paracoccaceae bacterium]